MWVIDCFFFLFHSVTLVLVAEFKGPAVILNRYTEKMELAKLVIKLSD